MYRVLVLVLVLDKGVGIVQKSRLRYRREEQPRLEGRRGGHISINCRRVRGSAGRVTKTGQGPGRLNNALGNKDVTRGESLRSIVSLGCVAASLAGDSDPKEAHVMALQVTRRSRSHTTLGLRTVVQALIRGRIEGQASTSTVPPAPLGTANVLAYGALVDCSRLQQTAADCSGLQRTAEKVEIGCSCAACAWQAPLQGTPWNTPQRGGGGLECACGAPHRLTVVSIGRRLGSLGARTCELRGQTNSSSTLLPPNYKTPRPARNFPGP